MTRVYVCGQAARVVKAISGIVHGMEPAAITLGDFVFVFEPKPEGEAWSALMRHEQVHIEQQARMAPPWARWLPKRLRVYLGAPKHARAYLEEWMRVGYENNRFEIEARAAE